MLLGAVGCSEEPDVAAAAAAYHRGVEEAQAGRLQPALREVERSLEFDDTNSPAHVLYAVLQERNNDLGRAEEHLARGLEISPQDVDIPLHLARVRGKRELDRQIDAAREHIQAAGPTPPRLVAFGDLLRKRERFEDAQTHYLMALRVAPPSAAAHAGLGLVYSHSQRQVRALYHLGEALRMDAAQSEARDELAWILATSSHEDLIDAGEAIRIAEAAAGDGSLGSSRSPRLLDALAAALAATGRFEEAQAAARAAVAEAQAAGDHVVAHTIEDRLRRYEAGQPYAGPPVDPS